MTDFRKWTDKQINEAIFEAKGWTREGTREFEGKQYTLWKNPDPTDYGQYTGAPDNYTHDWQLAGKLLEELPADVTTLSKYDDSVDGSDYWECVTGNALTGFSIICVSENPKRAICEAWLAWKGQG